MKDVNKIVADVKSTLAPYFKEIEETAYISQEKVLNAFHYVKAAESDLQGSTGCGYDDFGRDHLEEIYAQAFEVEDAIVRLQIISGTHAVTVTLQSLLKHGDELIYVTDSPYDTLLEVIDADGGGIESLVEHGVSYKDIALKEGKIDVESVLDGVSGRTKVIAIQRSKGYDQGPSIPLDEIERVITKLKNVHPNILIFVDNCYGEFVKRREPIECGVDLIVGSLIKNPGGGLVKIGEYIAGRKDLIERCDYRLTTPGIGKEAGASLSALLEICQGFFLAPHIVSQNLKGTLFTSLFLEKVNTNTAPRYYEKRVDLTQAAKFETKEQMISSCQSIQHTSPINAHFSPEPSYAPGYEDDVIMAAGTFIRDSSIELSADGPIRLPYEAYVQGGLTYEHVKIAVTRAVNQLKEQGLI